MTTAHAWLPTSPCATSCVDDGPSRVGVVRTGVRLVGLAALVTAFPALQLIPGRGRRVGAQRRLARAGLRRCGIELRLIDARDASSPGPVFAAPDTGVLVIAAHVGWTDVLVLAAVQPIGFVARADLVDWPVLGRLARAARVVPVDRSDLRRLPTAVAQVTDLLRRGEPMAVFPEGTTWCGRASGRLRPAFFQAAVDAAVPVQPIRLRYLDPAGAVATTAGFVGTESFAGSLLRLARSSGLTAEVVLLPTLTPDRHRRELARAGQRAVHGTMASSAKRRLVPA
ncbi:lysophospholipid acyltransferase family protein [Skermania piniformis]|uniref:1-acyl-sn-glycerol-3-phosphate acyltransferase n=1 Tax=Skermania pinensis TaxID=39122 RepID=A0ABX8SAL9_9ACTN|nr:lysophospholipid acyltransferase family protein [Skermania piniformis]QXQ12766.1 1-acyl-sn-glycerol-3-phosphate acyltransferase [Skermania piniformis]